jgi:hypothetical protein
VSGNVAHFDVSANGTLVSTAGGAALKQEVMILLSPDGGMDTVRIQPRSISQPRFLTGGREPRVQRRRRRPLGRAISPSTSPGMSTRRRGRSTRCSSSRPPATSTW